MVFSSALERGLAAFAEHRRGDAFDALTESDAITNAGNAVRSVYVFSLPLGPIWILHIFYLVASAIMLMWFLRYRRTWPARAPNTMEAFSTTALEWVR